MSAASRPGLLAWLRGPELRFDWRIVTITLASTLALVVADYRSVGGSAVAEHALLYGALPLVIIVLVFRERPASYGLTLGDWRAGLALTLVAIAVMTPVIWLLVHLAPSVRAYYDTGTGGVIASNLIELAAWEFFFRGFILFGYARRFGPEALWLQAVPFALAHLGKPEIETLSTIFGGFAFAWIAWRTRSVVWPAIIHFWIATFIVFAASGAVG